MSGGLRFSNSAIFWEIRMKPEQALEAAKAIPTFEDAYALASMYGVGREYLDWAIEQPTDGIDGLIAEGQLPPRGWRAGF